MGFRYGRTRTFGPVRITQSKTGTSWSVGGKRGRYTKRADGRVQRTIRLGGGVSHVKTYPRPSSSGIVHRQTRVRLTKGMSYVQNSPSMPRASRSSLLAPMQYVATPLPVQRVALKPTERPTPYGAFTCLVLLALALLVSPLYLASGLILLLVSAPLHVVPRTRPTGRRLRRWMVKVNRRFVYDPEKHSG